MRQTILSLVAAVSLGVASHDALAGVTPDQAATLKTTLTPQGAERAGNADGSIPAWTGGLTTLPAGKTAFDQMPDFHKSDSPVLTINAANADQYAAKLSIGVLYMLKHYPGYKIVIYPTHRDEAAPQWFYDSTFKNATTATLKDDNWVAGAHGGIPYPIPQNGKEAMWNANLTWYGVQSQAWAAAYIVAPGSTPLLNAVTHDQRWHPYTDPNYTSGSYYYYYLLAVENTVGPPNRIGNAILSYVTYDQTEAPLITWQYLVGQRRLRKAPSVTYDGAYPDGGGIITVDELALFNGPIDRYDAKLLPKREIYIPYDCNGIALVSSSQLLQPNFVNPDLVRWELHRVWPVDLTLAPGHRHLLPHRTVYLDEDTWQPVLSEDYDASGTMVKVGQSLSYTNPGFPGVFDATDLAYDTKGSGYFIENLVTNDLQNGRTLQPLDRPPSFYAPSTVAAESVR